ncbi:MAG: hypothetical protein WCG04_04080 [Alphaproteobacteria bacterium]
MFYKVLALSLLLPFTVSLAEAQIIQINYPHLDNTTNKFRNPLDPRNSIQGDETVSDHEDEQADPLQTPNDAKDSD